MAEILIATKANEIFQNYNENKEGNHERKKLTTQNWRICPGRSITVRHGNNVEHRCPGARTGPRWGVPRRWVPWSWVPWWWLRLRVRGRISLWVSLWVPVWIPLRP